MTKKIHNNKINNKSKIHNLFEPVPDSVWKECESFAPTLKKTIQKWGGMNTTYKPTYHNLRTWLQMYMEVQMHYSKFLELYEKLFGTYHKGYVDNYVNEENDAKSNYNFKYMAQMNDTPENRSNMDFLLKHGPNQDRTYDTYKFAWEDEDKENEAVIMKKLKKAIIKIMKEERLIK